MFKPSSGDIAAEALGLIEGEKNLVANLANLSSHFYHSIPGLNWAGFYLWDSKAGELVLGPFQGKPACLRIRPERGVCGKAYTTQKIQLVDDVHAFSGHIACDPQSRSELVIPMLWEGKCIGVLDLDAPVEKHFTQELAHFLENLMAKMMPLIWLDRE